MLSCSTSVICCQLLMRAMDPSPLTATVCALHSSVMLLHNPPNAVCMLVGPCLRTRVTVHERAPAVLLTFHETSTTFKNMMGCICCAIFTSMPGTCQVLTGVRLVIQACLLRWSCSCTGPANETHRSKSVPTIGPKSSNRRVSPDLVSRTELEVASGANTIGGRCG